MSNLGPIDTYGFILVLFLLEKLPACRFISIEPHDINLANYSPSSFFMSGLNGGSDGGGGGQSNQPLQSVGGVSVTPSHVGGGGATALSSSGSGSVSTTSASPMGVVKGSPSQYVKLNVGGSLHYTTIGTLTKHDNMLRAMFSGRMEVLSDAEGKRDESLLISE